MSNLDPTPAATSASDLNTLVTVAWHRRAAFHDDSATDCYRIFHGYSEGMPGLSIDRYGECAVINKKVDIPLAEAELVGVLTSLFPFTKVVVKSHQKIEVAKGERVRYLLGEPSTAPLKVREHGDFFFADPDCQHSNGLFLDARPARRWLKQNSATRRIYNMFAHTGSLGVAAKLGGASEVVHIDKNREALAKIRLNYEFNGLPPEDRGILAGDIYFHIPRAIKWGQRFQGVILDPPPHVPVPPKAPKHRPYGQDFATLIGLACDLLDDQGWLLCIYHDFRKTHDECDDEIVRAANGTLKPIWRDRADADFIESDVDRWTRMSAFIKTKA